MLFLKILYYNSRGGIWSKSPEHFILNLWAKAQTWPAVTAFPYTGRGRTPAGTWCAGRPTGSGPRWRCQRLLVGWSGHAAWRSHPGWNPGCFLEETNKKFYSFKYGFNSCFTIQYYRGYMTHNFIYFSESKMLNVLFKNYAHGVKQQV